jgi:hypothetical protein
MTSLVRKSIVTVFAGAAMVTAVASPASAQTRQDGLVNINVEDVNVTVPIAVAVDAVIQACDLADVGPVALAILGRATAVDNSGRDFTVCIADDAPITISQNVENA